jgi:4-hydroxy-tetrahydrodipicolinate synthase
MRTQGPTRRYQRGQAKEWVRQELSGYLVTTTTPFADDGSIDESALRSNVKRLLESSAVRGMYVGSIYQEPTGMTVAERKRVTDVVIEATEGAVPVVAGASANNIADAVELAQAAQGAGADLVMVWPPTFGTRTSEGVYQFIKAVAESVDIGICLYSTTLPEFGFRLKPEVVSRLADIENICAVKEASLSAAGYLEMLMVAGDKLTVSCPLEEYWLYGKLLGLPGAANFLLGSSRPLYLETGSRKLGTEFLAAVDAGDQQRTSQVLTQILRVVGELHNAYLEAGGHNVAITKAIVDLMGLVGGAVRPPVTPASVADIDRARKVLTDNRLLP